MKVYKGPIISALYFSYRTIGIIYIRVAKRIWRGITEEEIGHVQLREGVEGPDGMFEGGVAVGHDLEGSG